VASVGEYCRSQAAVCARLADGAATEEAKAKLLNLQQRWLEEAAEADTDEKAALEVEQAKSSRADFVLLGSRSSHRPPVGDR
jgi:hypothetical protein